MVDADVGLSGLFVANNVDTVTRGHSLKLFVQQSRIGAIDARKYFFLSHRVIQSIGMVCRPHQTIFHL